MTGWPGNGGHTGNDGTVLPGNWFGIGPTGTVIANSSSDLIVGQTANAVVIGGTGPGQGNRFAAAGNGDGVVLSDSPSMTQITGNTFGLGSEGVTMTGAPAEGLVFGTDFSGTMVRNNRFGHLPQAAIVATSNADASSSRTCSVSTKPATRAPTAQSLWTNTAGTIRLGGPLPGQGNTIANQLSQGVTIDSALTGTVTVLDNRFFANGFLDIDVGGDGSILNDPADVDTGANGLLNFPVITGTNAVAGTATTGIALTTTVCLDHGCTSFGPTSEFSQVSPDIGPALLDDSGHRSDLQAFGGFDPAVTAPGVVADAFEFDGVAQRLVGPATELDGALTLSSWVRLDTWGSDPHRIAKSVGGTDVYALSIDSVTRESTNWDGAAGGSTTCSSGALSAMSRQPPSA